MKILITSASGQIGSYVLEDFADKYEVIGVGLKPSLIKEKDLIVTGDLKDFKFVRNIVKDIDVSRQR